VVRFDRANGNRFLKTIANQSAKARLVDVNHLVENPDRSKKQVCEMIGPSSIPGVISWIVTAVMGLTILECPVDRRYSAISAATGRYEGSESGGTDQ